MQVRSLPGRPINGEGRPVFYPNASAEAKGQKPQPSLLTGMLTVDNEGPSFAEIVKMVGFRSRGAMARAFSELPDIDIESVRKLKETDLCMWEDRLARTMIRNWELNLGRKLPSEDGN